MNEKLNNAKKFVKRNGVIIGLAAATVVATVVHVKARWELDETLEELKNFSE